VGFLVAPTSIVIMACIYSTAPEPQVFRPDWIEKFNEGTSSNPLGKYNSSDCILTRGASDYEMINIQE
jgi:hypothetical protein